MHDLRRQSGTFDTGRLRSAKVAVVGDSTISNMLCAYLAGLGIGSIVLMGGGVRRGRHPMEPFSELSDVRNPKVRRLADILSRINPELQVLPYLSPQSRTLIESCDVVVDTTNDPDSKYMAYRDCKALGRLLVSCSSSASAASVRAYQFGEGGRTPVDELLMKDFEGVGQGLFTSGIAAVVAADEIRKKVCPVDSGEGDRRLEERVGYSVLSGSRFFRGRVPPRLMRHVEREDAMLERVRGKRALVVGAGGIGTYVLLNLAMLGVDVDVYDHDFVESHNLNRQVIHFGAVGSNKAEEAARKMGRVNRRARVRGFAEKMTREVLSGSLRDGVRYDAVFSCVDNWECRRDLDNYCRKSATPLFNGSVGTFECAVDHFIPGETHCLQCSSDYRRRIKVAGGATMSCADLDANVVMPNAMAGSLMVAESMRVLSHGSVPGIGSRNIRYRSRAGALGRFVLENRRLLCAGRKHYTYGCRCHDYLEQ